MVRPLGAATVRERCGSHRSLTVAALTAWSVLLLLAEHLDRERVARALLALLDLAGDQVGVLVELAVEDGEDLRHRAVGQAGADLDRPQLAFLVLHPHGAGALALHAPRLHLVDHR